MGASTIFFATPVEAALNKDMETRRSKMKEPQPYKAKELEALIVKHGVKKANAMARARAREIKRYHSPRTINRSAIVNEILSAHYKLPAAAKS